MARTLLLLELQMPLVLLLLLRLPAPICGIMERSINSSPFTTVKTTQTSPTLRTGDISLKSSGRDPIKLVALLNCVLLAVFSPCQLGSPSATMDLLVSTLNTSCIYDTDER